VEKEWGYQRFFSSSIEIACGCCCVLVGKAGSAPLYEPTGHRTAGVRCGKRTGLPALFFCWIEIAVVAVCWWGKGGAFWYLHPSPNNEGKSIKIHNCLFGELEIFELDTM
jgi:hypothetical protein